MPELEAFEHTKDNIVLVSCKFFHISDMTPILRARHYQPVYLSSRSEVFNRDDLFVLEPY